MMVRRYGARALEAAQENRENTAGDRPVGSAASGSGHTAGTSTPRGDASNAKTNPRSASESARGPQNEPKTNLNEPRTNPTPPTCSSPKPFRMTERCGRARRTSRECCSSGGSRRLPRRAGEAAPAVHANARSTLECGSLLPFCPSPACWPARGLYASGEDGGEQARESKRQQAAALQSFAGPQVALWGRRLCRGFAARPRTGPTEGQSQAATCGPASLLGVKPCISQRLFRTGKSAGAWNL